MSLPLDSPTAAEAAAGTTCHALPCNIDFTGKAPVEVFFRPAPFVVNDGHSDDEEQQQPQPKYQAATLRGRGLLAKAENNALDGAKIQGHVFSNDYGQQLKTVTQFDTLTEWHHEHLPAALAHKESRLRTAVDWLEIAEALHAPIPVAKK